MTTTINRQLTLLVQGIHGKYGIDNLQLEVDLVSSLQRMWVEGGKDPQKLSKIREEILDSLLAGAKNENEYIEMEGRAAAALRININGGSSFEEVIKFLIKKEKEGQTIEQYARWCNENPYNAPKGFQIAMTPHLLIRTWPMAFANVAPEEKKIISGTSTGFYA